MSIWDHAWQFGSKLFKCICTVLSRNYVEHEGIMKSNSFQETFRLVCTLTQDRKVKLTYYSGPFPELDRLFNILTLFLRKDIGAERSKVLFIKPSKWTSYTTDETQLATVQLWFEMTWRDWGLELRVKNASIHVTGQEFSRHRYRIKHEQFPRSPD